MSLVAADLSGLDAEDYPADRVIAHRMRSQIALAFKPLKSLIGVTSCPPGFRPRQGLAHRSLDPRGWRPTKPKRDL
jgi:hypothetical protein